jgi:hypothetical protein
MAEASPIPLTGLAEDWPNNVGADKVRAAIDRHVLAEEEARAAYDALRGLVDLPKSQHEYPGKNQARRAMAADADMQKMIRWLVGNDLLEAVFDQLNRRRRRSTLLTDCLWSAVDRRRVEEYKRTQTS